MVKVELGKKCICQNCGVRFYDLNKSSVVCPKCGTEYVKVIKKVNVENKKPKKKNVVENSDSLKSKDISVEDFEISNSDDLGDEDDEDLMEDTSDLGGDDEGLPAVKEGISTEDIDK